jgi:hypothetical protein
MDLDIGLVSWRQCSWMESQRQCLDELVETSIFSQCTYTESSGATRPSTSVPGTICNRPILATPYRKVRVTDQHRRHIVERPYLL